MRHAGIILSGAIALGLVPGIASACHATFNETWTSGGSATWSGAGNDCVLEATVSSSTPAAATVHYRRARPDAPLRLSFRVDPPVPTWNSNTSFTIARGTADRVPVGAPIQAALFGVGLVGNPAGTQVRATLSAACGSEPGGVCAIAVPAPLTFPHLVTIELQLGAGAAGRLLYWAGEDTSGPPTATIENLDNAAWGGVERVSLGVSDPTDGYISTFNGEPVVFDAISASEPYIFWSDFELGAGHPVASNASPIPMTSQSVVGTTCGGSDALPVLASGSTRVAGPKVIHSFTVGASQMPVFSLTSEVATTQMFVCEDGVSTTSRCVGAGKPGSPIMVSQPGRYQLVIGDRLGGCGTYVLSVGPLGLGG
ncbi:hypothetical protein ACQQ2N_05885 [Dokdonella sp. MW10]|uniref:hypothetical protein n=1 Tax=Dokdonella sp. MW10 TaxID=2992926 RepID=UPI003F8051CE